MTKLKYLLAVLTVALLASFAVTGTQVLAQEAVTEEAAPDVAVEGAQAEDAVAAAEAPAEEAGPVAGVNAATDTVYILNSLLFLIGGFLVFFMATGFAMLEGGLVRSKNVTMQMTKNVALFSFAAIAYYLVGYNLMYPLGSWSVGSDETGGYLGILFAPAVLEAVGITADTADDYGYASTGSDFFFQLMFCAAAA